MPCLGQIQHTVVHSTGIIFHWPCQSFADAYVVNSNVLFVAVFKTQVRYFRGRVSNFNLSVANQHCFLASDWLNFEGLPENTVLYIMYRHVRAP